MLCRNKALLLSTWPGVLFLVRFNNFDWTTGFYWSTHSYSSHPFFCAHLNLATIKFRSVLWVSSACYECTFNARAPQCVYTLLELSMLWVHIQRQSSTVCILSFLSHCHKSPPLLLLGEQSHDDWISYHTTHSYQPAPCLPVLHEWKCHHPFLVPSGRTLSSLHSRVYCLLEQYLVGWSHSSVGFGTKHSTTYHHSMSSSPSEFNSNTQQPHRMGDAKSGDQCHVFPEWNQDVIKYQFQSSRRGSLWRRSAGGRGTSEVLPRIQCVSVGWLCTPRGVFGWVLHQGVLSWQSPDDLVSGWCELPLCGKQGGATVWAV